MLRAVIFDFDGVIADAEPVHLRAFQLVLGEEGISLSREDYYNKYLALDDKTCFAHILKDNKRDFDKTLIDDLVARKSRCYDKFIENHIVIFPGVKDFVKGLYSRYFLAIGSGALRHEIETILGRAGLGDEFKIIVSAEDVENCKPHPEVFIKVLHQINRLTSLNNETIFPYECLVIEDSIAGIKAAHYAGMKCLAITNSYTAERLSKADVVVDSLERVKMEEIEGKLF
ncbi:MAG TPA: HAD family phosphatase [Thermodesulfobacteriota bacterium]|nr:HAD family phosphatase [Thermodesulfobacteriota bacterium]